jgi:transcriptional regulator GlxA family with amidase domain
MQKTHVDLLTCPQGLLGPLFQSMDVLMLANQFWRLSNPRRRGLPFSWRVIDGLGRPVELPGWQQYSQEDAGALPTVQTALVLPGLQMHNIPHLRRIVETLSAERALVTARHAGGGVIAAGFNTSVLLAEWGLLDGREATTSWLLASWFANTYPSVRLVMDKPVSVDGAILCSGAPAAHAQLMLALVERFAGEELANRCATAVLYQQSRFEQSVLTPTPVTRDSVVYKARRHLEQHLREPYSLQMTAAAASVSPRTLLRHFREVQAMSPLDYLHRLRIERARQLLEVTVLDLPQVIEQCGYQDPSAFRRLFLRETGMTPSDYRARYAVRAQRRWWRAEDPT